MSVVELKTVSMMLSASLRSVFTSLSIRPSFFWVSEVVWASITTSDTNKRRMLIFVYIVLNIGLKLVFENFVKLFGKFWMNESVECTSLYSNISEGDLRKDWRSTNAITFFASYCSLDILCSLVCSSTESIMCITTSHTSSK